MLPFSPCLKQNVDVDVLLFLPGSRGWTRRVIRFCFKTVSLMLSDVVYSQPSCGWVLVLNQRASVTFRGFFCVLSHVTLHTKKSYEMLRLLLSFSSLLTRAQHSLQTYAQGRTPSGTVPTKPGLDRTSPKRCLQTYAQVHTPRGSGTVPTKPGLDSVPGSLDPACRCAFLEAQAQTGPRQKVTIVKNP